MKRDIISSQELYLGRISYLDSDFFNKCFRLIEKENKIAYFYRKLITYPIKSTDKESRRRAKILQTEFRLDAEDQLIEIFQVKSIYEIEEEFATQVQYFYQDIYLPSEELINKIIRMGKEIYEIRLALNEYYAYEQAKRKKTYISDIETRLEESVYRQISDRINSNPIARIKIFIDEL